MACPSKRILIVAALLWATAANARELPGLGRTWPIAERDMIEVIHAEINKGKWKEGMTPENFKHLVEEFKPADLAKLPRAGRNREFSPDLTVTLDVDIPGPDGKILYPKGFRYDPAKYVPLVGRYVVLDLSDPDQRAWFVKEKLNDAGDVTIISSGGSFAKLGEELKRPVYYLQQIVVDRLKLKAVPSIVSKEKGRIMVREIKVEAQ